MRVPKYCRNGDGRAFVAHPSIPTKSHRLYLGTWGTKASREQYEKWVTDFLTAAELEAETRNSGSPVPEEKPTVAMLAVKYLAHARIYYSKNGVPTKEHGEMETAIGHVIDVLAAVPGEELGPRHIRKLQNHLIKLGYRRGVINLRVGRAKRFVKWCCQEELIPPSVYQGLLVVDGLRRGRSDAKESVKVKPVPRPHFLALQPFMSPPIRAMSMVQLLAGMRPAEACIMRPMDITPRGDVWLYRPESHKTVDSGRTLVKAITREAQEILRPFLEGCAPDQYIFRPELTKEWRYSRRTVTMKPERKTPVYPSELKARAARKAERARARRGRKWGERYNTDSYRRAISYARTLAAKNGVVVPHWHPHQLRHTIATEISHAIGEQAAQVWLGHASLNTTAIYTERDIEELVTVARRVAKLSEEKQPPAQSAAEDPRD